MTSRVASLGSGLSSRLLGGLTTSEGCTEALQLTSYQEGSGAVVLIRTGCSGIRNCREIHSHRLKPVICA